MITIGFFLLGLSIFVIFFTLITLFGFFFQYHIFSIFKEKKFNLTILLESFGIGTLLFICYSYLIINFFRAFNFFTIYLPLIIFDILNLILFLKKRRINIKEIIQNLLSKKQNILLLFFTCLFLLLVMGVIETHLSLGSTDPFRWTESVLYLLRYGDFYYDFMTVRTGGFVIFCAGALLITNELYIQYFFIKYVSTFIFFINILVIYKIVSRFFNKKIEIFICLIIALSFNYLLYRSALFLPSVLTVPLCLIFFMTLFEEESLRILVIRGFLIAGIFLSHILYGLFFLIYFLMYEIINIILILKKNLKTKEFKSFKLISNFLKQNGILLLIISICIIPYILNLVINGYNLFNYTIGFHFNLNNLTIKHIPNLIKFSSFNVKFIKIMNPIETNIIYNIIIYGLSIIVNKTLNWGVIFIILGLFYWKKSFNTKENYIINFIKFSFILTVIIFIVDSCLLMSQDKMIFTVASFINQFGPRVFEIFSPLWCILVIFSIKMIFDHISNKKNKNINRGMIKQENTFDLTNRFNKAYLIIIMVLGASLYSSHLIIHYNFFYTSYYDDDDLPEAVLFITDYFNDEEFDDYKEIRILLPEHPKTNIIYHIIYQKNIEKFYLEFDETSYSELRGIIDDNETDFVLVDKSECKESCISEVKTTMDILFDNTRYLFCKL